jgi:CRISPR-associated endonuclease Cas2
MEKITLFVVLLVGGNHNERAKARETLKYYGLQKAAGVFEVIAPTSRMQRLHRELEKLSNDDDWIRIYPVCNRCQTRANMFVPLELQQFGPCLIF